MCSRIGATRFGRARQADENTDFVKGFESGIYESLLTAEDLAQIAADERADRLWQDDPWDAYIRLRAECY